MPNDIATDEDQTTVGRYHAEHVRLSRDREPHEKLRGVLDAAEE